MRIWTYGRKHLREGVDGTLCARVVKPVRVMKSAESLRVPIQICIHAGRSLLGGSVEVVSPVRELRSESALTPRSS